MSFSSNGGSSSYCRGESTQYFIVALICYHLSPSFVSLFNIPYMNENLYFFPTPFYVLEIKDCLF